MVIYMKELIDTAGMLRCCLLTIEQERNNKAADSIEDKTILHCEYCSDGKMMYHKKDNTWRAIIK